MSKRAVELGKDLVILLLVLAALWLVSRPQLYGRQVRVWLDQVTAPAGQTAVDSGETQTDTAQGVRPVRMAAMTRQGRYGTPYDAAGTQQLFSVTADLLNEALSSAQTPQRVSRSDWEAALQTAPGIYFEFPCALPLSALGSLLSEEGQGDGLTGVSGQLCLTVRAGGVSLFYIDGEDGLYYACATDVVSASHLETVLSGLTPNGTSFAFERQDCDNLASYTMLPDQTPAPVVWSAADPLTEETRESLLERLQFRSAGGADYEATDGLVYLDGGDSLRVGAGGKVTYSAAQSEEGRFRVPAQGETPTQAENISAAIQLVQTAMAPWQGEAELCLTGYEELEDGSVQLEFDYYLNGARVLRYDGSAAAVILIEGDQITRFTLQLRSYTQGTEQTVLLPVTQAAAAVSALEGDGGELMLCYHDNGGDTAVPGWTVAR
jgi:hypothetical protein